MGWSKSSTTRRTFLQTSGAAVSAALLVPRRSLAN